MRRISAMAALALSLSAGAAVQAAEPAPVANLPTLLFPRSELPRVAAPPDAAATARELDAMRGMLATRPADLGQRLQRWEAGGAIYRWNQVAVADQVDRFVLVAHGTRNLALLHAALYDTTVAVAEARARYQRGSPAAIDPALALPGMRPVANSYPSEVAAVGEAAAIILGALMPDRADAYRAMADEAVMLRQQAEMEFPSDAEAGRAIGAAVAAVALQRARTDGSDQRWAGTVPTGPGRWQGTTPYAPMAGSWRPFVLASNDALRPPPPPAHDSEETLAALAELKAYPRAPKTNHDAVYWEVFGGARIYQLWNAELSRMVLEENLSASPHRVAAAYAALNIALYDSMLACWEAKYTYWYIRPHQLDPALRPVVSVPGHPSYPSAHSCISSAAGGVMARQFPTDAEAFTELARRASESRIAAGLHFRFDVDAGNAIGQGVADLVVAKLSPAMR